MKITVLVDNKTEHTECEAEWGLSLLIETAGKKILFDAGASDMFVRNASKLGIDLANVDAVVISHGHFDHTGGMEAFAERNHKAKIYLREQGLVPTFEIEPDGSEYPTGVRWSDDFRERIKDRFIFTDGEQSLFDRVFILSDIPRRKEFLPSGEFFFKLPVEAPELDSVQYAPDRMRHEQILVAEEDEKLFVFSGCSHNGVLAILQYVTEKFPGKEIAAFVAGMHLYDFRGERLESLLEKMQEYHVENYLPLHCTGMNAILRMKEKFGRSCIIAMAGDVVTL